MRLQLPPSPRAVLTSIMTVLALGMLSLFALQIYSAWTRGHPIDAPVQEGAPTDAPSDNPADLSLLFGSTPLANTATGQTPSPSQANLTLMGSFVRPNPTQSSAIIRGEGNSSKRVHVGEEVQPGLKLHAVQRDHVELDRQGQIETLTFPKGSAAQPQINDLMMGGEMPSDTSDSFVPSYRDFPTPDAANMPPSGDVPPGMLPSPGGAPPPPEGMSYDQLRQQMDVLRQQMEQDASPAETPPPTPDVE